MFGRAVTERGDAPFGGTTTQGTGAGIVEIRFGLILSATGDGKRGQGPTFGLRQTWGTRPTANAVVRAIAEDAAKGVAETTGGAIARDAFKAIPGVGSLVSAFGFAHDLDHAFQDYLACTEGGR